MDFIRQIVWEMREAGEVEVLQRREVIHVDSLEDIKGPIRIRRVQE